MTATALESRVSEASTKVETVEKPFYVKRIDICVYTGASDTDTISYAYNKYIHIYR